MCVHYQLRPHEAVTYTFPSHLSRPRRTLLALFLWMRLMLWVAHAALVLAAAMTSVSRP